MQLSRCQASRTTRAFYDEIVVEPVPRPSELRGRLATDEYERGEITVKLQEFRDSERVEERPRDVANPDGDE